MFNVRQPIEHVLEAGDTALGHFVERRWQGNTAAYGACDRAASLSTELADAIARLQADWFERAGRPRRDSAAARIIGTLPAQPITSAPPRDA